MKPDRLSALPLVPALALLPLLLLAAGCALKAPPDSAAVLKEALPNAQPPAAWKAGAGATSTSTSTTTTTTTAATTATAAANGAPRDDGIASFGDPLLNRLVAEALQYNNDLRAAAARVEQAAAGVKAAGGQMLPAVDLLGRSGGKLGGDGSGLNGGLITASWEVDLWGRVRYAARRADGQYAASQADLAAARQSIAALVAKSWFLATEASLQRQLAADMIKAGDQSVALAEQRWRIGIGSELELVQARASRAGYVDAERQLQLAHGNAVRSLELLLGRYPAAELQTTDSWPRLDIATSTGVPAQLLERRPDLAAAQLRIAAAFDGVQEAQAARLPRITLTAGISQISSELFVLKERDNPGASAGASLAVPLFHGYALQAQVEARSAEQKQAVALWAQTVLKAFGEVETALASEDSLREREPLLAAQLKDSQRALALEEQRYKVGSRDLRSVTQQQMAVYAVRASLLRLQADRCVQRVNLLLALGGNLGASADGRQAGNRPPAEPM